MSSEKWILFSKWVCYGDMVRKLCGVAGDAIVVVMVDWLGQGAKRSDCDGFSTFQVHFRCDGT